MCREFFKSQQFALRLLLSTVISCKDIVNIIVDFIPIFETFQQSFQEEHKDILQNIQAESYKRWKKKINLHKKSIFVLGRIPGWHQHFLWKT